MIVRQLERAGRLLVHEDATSRVIDAGDHKHSLVDGDEGHIPQ
jgi:hypothetical protein